jgi:DNA-binding IclR family transcriptional regulator
MEVTSRLLGTFVTQESGDTPYELMTHTEHPRQTAHHQLTSLARVDEIAASGRGWLALRDR